MRTEKINRLKIVLVEQGKIGKWLAEQLGENEATFWGGAPMRVNLLWKCW